MSDVHETVAPKTGRAPLEIPSASRRTRAMLCLFAGGFDTQAIAGLLHVEEAEVANTLSRLRLTAGAALVDGQGRRPSTAPWEGGA